MRNKRRSGRRSDELDRLRRWITVVVEFRKHLAGDQQDIFSAPVEEAVRRTWERGDTKGMKMIKRDLLEWSKGLSPKLREVLDDSLRSELGTGLQEATDQTLQKVAAILQRGRIVDDDECELVLNRVEEIHGDSSRAEEVARLNSLLARFDTPGGDGQKD